MLKSMEDQMLLHTSQFSRMLCSDNLMHWREGLGPSNPTSTEAQKIEDVQRRTFRVLLPPRNQNRPPQFSNCRE